MLQETTAKFKLRFWEIKISGGGKKNNKNQECRVKWRKKTVKQGPYSPRRHSQQHNSKLFQSTLYTRLCLSTVHVLTHLILTANLDGRQFYHVSRMKKLRHKGIPS